MAKKYIKWTDEMLYAEAKKYNSRYEFQTHNISAYRFACKKKILDEICDHMMARFAWTDVMLKKEALKYNNKKDFRKYNLGAYSAAHRRKIIDDICLHMTGNVNWTNKSLQQEALKYKTRMDFVNGNTLAYSAAQRRNILDDICHHMVWNNGIHWSNEMLHKEAQKYDTRLDFIKGNSAAYQAALKRNMLNDICIHMVRGTNGFSSDKAAILYYIKFESAHSLPIYKIGITNRNTEDRLKCMRVNKEYTPTIVKEFYFESGREAYTLEQLYHKEYKECRYYGDIIMHNGNTELYYIDILGFDINVSKTAKENYNG